MRDFAPVYIISRLGEQVLGFFRHWYVGGFETVAHGMMGMLKMLDERVALVITARHFLEPLYQDHTVVGHLLGFAFRSIRLVLGAMLYSLVAAVAITLYLAWALVPIYLSLKVFGFW